MAAQVECHGHEAAAAAARCARRALSGRVATACESTTVPLPDCARGAPPAPSQRCLRAGLREGGGGAAGAAELALRSMGGAGGGSGRECLGDTDTVAAAVDVLREHLHARLAGVCGGEECNSSASVAAPPSFAFVRPKAALEQYITSPALAAAWLAHASAARGDVCARTRVLDLGCGTGMLSCAAAIAGAACVTAVDCDADALEQLSANVDALGVGHRVCALRARVGLEPRLPHVRRGAFDVVLTNPPFGTKMRGADTFFLCAARETGARIVYSLHKSATRQFVRSLALGELGYTGAELVAEMEYVLPRCRAHHVHDSHTLSLDLWRLELDAARVGTERPPVDRSREAPAPEGVAHPQHRWHFANDDVQPT